MRGLVRWLIGFTIGSGVVAGAIAFLRGERGAQVRTGWQAHVQAAREAGQAAAAERRVVMQAKRDTLLESYKQERD